MVVATDPTVCVSENDEEECNIDDATNLLKIVMLLLKKIKFLMMEQTHKKKSMSHKTSLKKSQNILSGIGTNFSTKSQLILQTLLLEITSYLWLKLLKKRLE